MRFFASAFVPLVSLAAQLGNECVNEGSSSPETETFLQVFNVFHSSLPDSVKSYNSSAVRLYAVSEELIQKPIPEHAQHLQLVKEWTLSRHDAFFQELGFHETSAILHVGLNGLHRGSKFIGFSQYDHFLEDLPSESSELPSNAAFFFMYGSVLVDEPAFPRSFVQRSYRHHFGQALDISGSMAKLGGNFPACNTWIIPTSIYEKLWPWWLRVACDLIPWLKQEPYPFRHHRHIAGVMERIMGISILAENLELNHGRLKYDADFRRASIIKAGEKDETPAEIVRKYERRGTCVDAAGVQSFLRQ